MRVLVVEDARALAAVLVEGLSDQGMAVDVAHDGLEAAAKLDLNAYDVVVLDRDLPGIHGDALCRMIAERDERVMVLMLTAAGSPADRVTGLTLGADDYLAKPFHFPELVLRIRSLARRRPTARPRTLRAADIELDPLRRTARLVWHLVRRLCLLPGAGRVGGPGTWGHWGAGRQGGDRACFDPCFFVCLSDFSWGPSGMADKVWKHVILLPFMMKDVNIYESDPEGFLYDPRVRVAMARFADDDGDLGDLLTFEAGAAVRTANHAVERMRAHGSQGRGVSAGALDLLIRLHAGERGISIGELARAAGISPRNATGLVDTLEHDGLVRRVPDPGDRRSVLAEITSAGRAWVEAFREPSRLAMRAMFQGFTPEELIVLRDLCLRLAANQHRLADHLRQVGQRP
ncbi:response regulator [Streptosporangium sp. NPDC049078]|uniref:response regulator n=1 Tax=Streptosporangium sp. NPDC049078 TaxID=3155767 RepID=UPI00342A1607